MFYISFLSEPAHLIIEKYHKSDSALLKLPINKINVVCLDYMHCVCFFFFVTKRLVEFWVKRKRNIRMTEKSKESINNDLIMLRLFVPSEFCRLPRPIDDKKFWKSTELRSFVLNIEAIVLIGKLKLELYQHFLLLVFTSRILVSPNTCYKYNSKAYEL